MLILLIMIRRINDCSDLTTLDFTSMFLSRSWRTLMTLFFGLTCWRDKYPACVNGVDESVRGRRGREEEVLDGSSC